MNIILGGKFETALVRSIDEIIQPQRNASTHPYYLGLNRKVSKAYFDRSATLIAIADETLVPSIDWNYPYGPQHRGQLRELDFGIKATELGGGEWDRDSRAFVEMIMKQRILSQNSIAHISSLSLSHYAEQERAHLVKQLEELSEKVADHYLNRLFLQLRAAREANAFLVIGRKTFKFFKRSESIF